MNLFICWVFISERAVKLLTDASSLSLFLSARLLPRWAVISKAQPL